MIKQTKYLYTKAWFKNNIKTTSDPNNRNQIEFFKFRGLCKK